MIYVTGDIHGDVNRFSDDNLENEGIERTGDDLFIVCGNFCIPFGYPYEKEDRESIDFLEKTGSIYCFVDGCHDNHTRLKDLPVVKWNGGLVKVVSDSIYYLLRGEIYNLDGSTVLAFGGGISADKEMRQQMGKFWWPEERPSIDDYANLVENVKKYNKRVDYVITHTPPVPFNVCKTEVSERLNCIKDFIEYKKWYCGYMQHNGIYPADKLRCLYQKVVKLGE